MHYRDPGYSNFNTTSVLIKQIKPVVIGGKTYDFNTTSVLIKLGKGLKSWILGKEFQYNFCSY